ncbi:uncharacterized protein [Diadema antillarum]|uniref:uncharacterized protein n=1 Tax=Diadema antillarum TaxID=105358 RepID=UPI003A84CB76
MRNSIPDRSSPGSPRTAPFAGHQDGGDKCATGGHQRNKIRGRENIAIATWNVRTLAATGKLEELEHELKNYTWDIVGLCETRWKNFGQHQTKEGNILYYSGEKDIHAKGVGFLVNKNIKDSVMECCPISSRLITIRLKAAPFNISIVQVYAPTTDYEDEVIEEFYTELQNTVEKTNKKDILIIQGDWNAKVGIDEQRDWKEHYGTSCNENTNDRGRRLLEFATYNNLALANTLGHHKDSRCWTWHAPNGTHHQIDYTLVQNRFRSGINRAKTRTFPGADVGSDHDLIIMNFRVRLKKTKRPSNTRLKFDLDKLKDPAICEVFQATIGGKFAPLLVVDEDPEVLCNTFNTVMTDTAKQVLGYKRKRKKPWVNDNILKMCDARRKLKNLRHSTGKAEYSEINKMIRKSMKQAKENWIEQKCADIETNLERNNSRKAFEIVKSLTKQEQSRATTIQDKNGKCLTESGDITARWTEYCRELYNHRMQGDPGVLKMEESTNADDFPILREEVEAAIKSLKNGKAAGDDNIPAELIKNGDEEVVNLYSQQYATRSG